MIKVIDTIQIGGKEHEVFLSFRSAEIILKRFFRLVKKNSATDINQIPPDFFIDSIWMLLKKKGFWIFKKPFRNKKKLFQIIHRDEFIALMTYVGTKVLGVDEIKEGDKKTDEGSEDREQGNSQIPGQDTI